MDSKLAEIISEQTDILLFNVRTTLAACEPDYMLCGQPVWKHLYHALHSLDQWFINPEGYEQPFFHDAGLNSLDEESSKKLSRIELIDYYESVKVKVLGYLARLTDDMLGENPEGCEYSRLALILGQYRHLCTHLGNINAAKMVQTGEWTRVVGMDADFSQGLYE